MRVWCADSRWTLGRAQVGNQRQGRHQAQRSVALGPLGGGGRDGGGGGLRRGVRPGVGAEEDCAEGRAGAGDASGACRAEEGGVGVDVDEEELDKGELDVERGAAEELRAGGEGRDEERRREELDEEVEEPREGSRGRPSKLTVSPAWRWPMTLQASGRVVRQNPSLANWGGS